MEVISSAKNQFIKLAHSLSQKKFREETGLFLVEGINIIKDMPQNVEVLYIFYTNERMDEAERIFLKKKLSADFKSFLVTEDVMQTLADTVSPYGIAAVLKINKAEFKMPNGKALLLDHVQDPGNLGTILRTAAACDFKNIYLLDSVDVYSPKVVRSSLGGLFKVNCMEVNEEQALELVKGSNSAVLDMGGKNILDKKISGDILFVCGNEAHGVSKVFIDNAKTIYSLPMQNDIESLNVAIATAVAMYQTV